MNPIEYVFIPLLLVVVFSVCTLYVTNKQNKELYRDLAIAQDEVQTLQVKLHNMGKPALKTMWQHSNGGIYEVIGYANLKTSNHHNYPVSIIYENVHGDVWVRPLADWHRSFTAYNK